MAKKKTTSPPLPPTKTLQATEKLAESCRRCDLYKNATQVVFGEGSAKARVMIVGEQPGNQEDLQGEPFVGPAGDLLRHCVQEAGLTMEDIYVTNAVKHFKFVPQGKRRLHQKPNAAEIRACRPWLEREIELIKPKMILALGATAAQSLFQRAVKITEERGKIIKGSDVAETVVISWHPSAILRNPDREGANEKRKELIRDLKLIRSLLKGKP